MRAAPVTHETQVYLVAWRQLVQRGAKQGKQRVSLVRAWLTE